MTRALHITRDFPPRRLGGLSTAVGQMVEALVEIGTECAVISFDEWRPRARPGGGELSRDEQYGASIARLRGPGALPAAAEFARDFAPSVIHVHHSMLWPFAARLRNELNAPAIKSVHVAHAHQNQLRGLDQTASGDAQCTALTEADAVIAPTTAAAEAVARYTPELEARITVIPLGTRDSDRARAAARSPGERDPTLILYAGRFSDINGTQDLLWALPEILRSSPTATAVIAGGLPANRKANAKWLRRWTEQAPDDIADRVSFPGWLSPAELSELYATCAVLVSPSWFETFGLVVLEAMLHGAPIAASRSGGVESTLKHLESGYLFEAQSTDALIDATNAILHDRTVAERLGRRAAEVARSEFLWSAIAPRLCRLYEKLE